MFWSLGIPGPGTIPVTWLLFLHSLLDSLIRSFRQDILKVSQVSGTVPSRGVNARLCLTSAHFPSEQWVTGSQYSSTDRAQTLLLDLNIGPTLFGTVHFSKTEFPFKYYHNPFSLGAHIIPWGVTLHPGSCSRTRSRLPRASGWSSWRASRAHLWTEACPEQNRVGQTDTSPCCVFTRITFWLSILCCIQELRKGMQRLKPESGTGRTRDISQGKEALTNVPMLCPQT